MTKGRDKSKTKVSSRAFFRNPYAYLKDLPIVVTRGGIPKYVVTNYNLKSVSEKEAIVEVKTIKVEDWKPDPKLSKKYFSRK